MAKRFHIGFCAKCKKCDEMYMCCIYRLEEEAFWATSWQTHKMTFVPSEDSDQPGHPPSLIRVFTVRSMGSLGPNFASGGQSWLWSDWADAQADLSLRWAHKSANNVLCLLTFAWRWSRITMTLSAGVPPPGCSKTSVRQYFISNIRKLA